MSTELALNQLSHGHMTGFTGRDSRAARLFNRVYVNPHPNLLQKLLGRKIQPLLDLSTVEHNRSLSNRRYAGTQTIAVNDIHGTINRAEDFDNEFHPLKVADEDRWCRVASAMMNGVGLPPIEVVQVGNEYFVKDGHHRISVARALGFRYLDALVEVWAEA